MGHNPKWQVLARSLPFCFTTFVAATLKGYKFKWYLHLIQQCSWLFYLTEKMASICLYSKVKLLELLSKSITVEHLLFVFHHLPNLLLSIHLIGLYTYLKATCSGSKWHKVTPVPIAHTVYIVFEDYFWPFLTKNRKYNQCPDCYVQDEL